MGRERDDARGELQRWAVPDTGTAAARPGAGLGHVGPLVARASRVAARSDLHLDQVAMVLALAAESVPTEQPDVRWNTPIHDPSRMPPDPPVPAVIHYHQEIDPDGRIRATGFPSIDRQIER